jgi:hypothetical protein
VKYWIAIVFLCKTAPCWLPAATRGHGVDDGDLERGAAEAAAVVLDLHAGPTGLLRRGGRTDNGTRDGRRRAAAEGTSAGTSPRRNDDHRAVELGRSVGPVAAKETMAPDGHDLVVFVQGHGHGHVVVHGGLRAGVVGAVLGAPARWAGS